MRIWHQSFTDLDVFAQYRETLQAHADAVMGAHGQVVVHGLRPGTYPPGVAPMTFNSRASMRMLTARQVCEAAQTAQAAGYDAFALGCFFDPGLIEARALVDIPVVSLTESCLLTACSLGRKVGMIALTPFQKMQTEDLAAQYGLSGRLSGVVVMAPAVDLFELEDDAAAVSIGHRFVEACRSALAQGAEVIIPGDGVLNEFLVRRRLLSVEGAVVLDALGVLFHHAAFFANARSAGCLEVSRRLLYAQPSEAMTAHAERELGARAYPEEAYSGRAR